MGSFQFAGTPGIRQLDPRTCKNWWKKAWNTAWSNVSLTQRKHALQLPSGSASIIAFVFLLTSCICVAVSLMCIWHLYLVGSAQTTIEFYKNRLDAVTWVWASFVGLNMWPSIQMQARQMGMKWINQFDLGWRENWDVVFGPKSLWFRWLLPSSQKPGSCRDQSMLNSYSTRL